MKTFFSARLTSGSPRAFARTDACSNWGQLLGISGLCLAACSAMAATPPITVAVPFNQSALIAGLQNIPTKYNNVDPTIVDPSALSSDTFVKQQWFANLAVPNSIKARNDYNTANPGSPIPADWYLESVTFSYTAKLVNWIAVNNNTQTPNATLTFHWDRNVSLYRNFNGTSGDLVSSTDRRLPLSGENSTPTLLPNGITPALSTADFPFAPDYQGSGAYVAAPNNIDNPGLANPAYTRTDPLTTTAPAFSDSANGGKSYDFVGGGTEFITFQGSSSGTIPVSFVATGGFVSSSNTGLSIAQRTFSTGDMTVSFVFVPEAGTWAAGLSTVLLVGGLMGRRARKQ